MIYFCDACCYIKEENAFDEFFEYERNVCIDCKENDTQEADIIADIDLDELDMEGAPEMQFGETDEDFEDRLRRSLEIVQEEQDIFDGEEEL